MNWRYKNISDSNVKLCFVDDGVEMIMPGEHGKVYLTLLCKMVMLPGQSFTIRENKITVATGIITETLPQIVIMKNLGKLELAQK